MPTICNNYNYTYFCDQKSSKNEAKTDENAPLNKQQNVTNHSSTNGQHESIHSNGENQQNQKDNSNSVESVESLKSNANPNSNSVAKTTDAVGLANPEITLVDKDKIIMELKQTIKELEEVVYKKNEHIKTLQLSHESIENTLQMTKNQYAKLQQDYDILQKQHNHAQSMS
ncbi:hypothetical protein RFI_26192 [Reticulomyxa filosa]|uniref:Uncharacterized protein n=1 Tax=Reticulomyxa filosa TaxID=46433 RepID=X6MDR5_RETFI|nr:hypothetical protein RFI_26192 [Reticulomyxa filosa]|eukprot:ETO11185.1 hypothetical protein RFI_26192 [Reticulomyxa filosa]